MQRVLGLFLLFLLPSFMMAQESVAPADGASTIMQVRGNIVFTSGGKKIKGPSIVYYKALHKTLAHEAEKKFQEIFRAGADPGEMGIKSQELRTTYQIESTTLDDFKANVNSSMSIIIIDEEDGEVVVVDMEAGKKRYKVEMPIRRRLQGVDIERKMRNIDIAISTTEDLDDGNERFRIKIKLSPGYARDDSRLLIQQYVADCQTEDTIAYGAALAYEGEAYHTKQDKRMSFNYFRNDRVAPNYQSGIVLDESRSFELDTIVVWQRPVGKEHRKFNAPFTYSLEDYNHVYLQKDVEGSCLRYRPFKMLDFNKALANIEFSPDFYMAAESFPHDKKIDINLRFKFGTSELVVDSLNDITKRNLVHELSSYGRNLVSLTIIGSASPDGSSKRNQELAQQRANVARSIIQNSGRIAIPASIVVKPHSWMDVVDSLRQQGHDDMAQQVADIVAGGGNDLSLTSRVSSLPFYSLYIEPVLEHQRAMTCQYQYQLQEVMNPTECRQEYFSNKAAYKRGDRHLSSGDFYNLFDTVTDSLELDTITMIAYREITSVKDYVMRDKMAPYVCNRMAILRMKQGMPDVEILRPLIDFSRNYQGKFLNIDYDENHRVQKHSPYLNQMVLFNRKQIVINQAICYYMKQRVDTAMFLVNSLKAQNIDDEYVTQLNHLLMLKKLHSKRNRTAQEQFDYNAAKNAVLDLSDENKAILYTEVDEWDRRKDAPNWVNKLDDSDARKWYLKGVLSALKANESGGNVEQEVPEYLVYFQHCFDLDDDKTYFRFYLEDSHIDAKLRRKYPYKKKKRDLYRQLFVGLYKRDSAEAQALLNGSLETDGIVDANQLSEDTADKDMTEDNKQDGKDK